MLREEEEGLEEQIQSHTTETPVLGRCSLRFGAEQISHFKSSGGWNRHTSRSVVPALQVRRPQVPVLHRLQRPPPVAPQRPAPHLPQRRQARRLHHHLAPAAVQVQAVAHHQPHLPHQPQVPVLHQPQVPFFQKPRTIFVKKFRSFSGN